jgi:hypothetical protein
MRRQNNPMKMKRAAQSRDRAVAKRPRREKDLHYYLSCAKLTFFCRKKKKNQIQKSKNQTFKNGKL